jgi:hypothetical protein
MYDIYASKAASSAADECAVDWRTPLVGYCKSEAKRRDRIARVIRGVRQLRQAVQQLAVARAVVQTGVQISGHPGRRRR